MRRRRAIVGLILLALVAVVAFALRTRVPHPCRATLEEVREGMTFEEVCATVGGPPGDYAGMGVSLRNLSGTGPAPPDMHLWAADDTILFVRFGKDGRAVEVSANWYPPPRPPSWLDRARERLGF